MKHLGTTILLGLLALPIAASAEEDRTGLYLGGIIGGTFSALHTSTTDLGGTISPPWELQNDATGIFGGLSTMYLFEFDNGVVIGGRASATYGNRSGSNMTTFTASSVDVTESVNVNFAAGVDAIVGYAAQNFFLYGLAGVEGRHTTVSGAANVTGGGALIGTYGGDYWDPSIKLGAGAQFGMNGWLVGPEIAYNIPVGGTRVVPIDMSPSGGPAGYTANHWSSGSWSATLNVSKKVY